MKGLLVCITLLLALFTSTAGADVGMLLAFGGHSVEFEDDSLGYTLLSWGRAEGKIAIFRGATVPWAVTMHSSTIRRGIGVVMLPDGRRCIFDLDENGLAQNCEANPLWENWSGRFPVVVPSAFPIVSIAVLSPYNPAATQAGQVPMVFALDANNQVWLTQYLQNAWSAWRPIVKVVGPGGEALMVASTGIAATWDVGCITKAVVAVRGPDAISTFWVQSGLTLMTNRRDAQQLIPISLIAPLDRVAPVPTGRCGSVGTSTRTDAIVLQGGVLYYYDSTANTVQRITTGPGVVWTVQVNSTATSNTAPYAIRVRIDQSGGIFGAAITPATRLNPTWTKLSITGIFR